MVLARVSLRYWRHYWPATLAAIERHRLLTLYKQDQGATFKNNRKGPKKQAGDGTPSSGGASYNSPVTLACLFLFVLVMWRFNEKNNCHSAIEVVGVEGRLSVSRWYKVAAACAELELYPLIALLNFLRPTDRRIIVRSAFACMLGISV